MTEADLDALIAANAQALGLTLQPAWHSAIRANLEITRRMAALVAAFPLDDEAEPAPVFQATVPTP